MSSTATGLKAMMNDGCGTMKNLRLFAFICASTVAAAAARAGDVELQLTVGTDLSDGACATSTSAEVNYGDLVNLCYRMTNNTGETLEHHVLRDDLFAEYDEIMGIHTGNFAGINVSGRLMTLTPIKLPPGASHQHNRIVRAVETVDVNAAWRGLADTPGYEVDEFLINPGPGDPGGGSGFHRAVIDISETGEELVMPTELWPRVAVELPFEYEFYGLASKQLVLSEYGTVNWDMSYWRGNTMANNPGPLQVRQGPSMQPFWTDMFGSGGRFLFQVVGEAPRRRAILQWDELKYHSGQFPASDTVTFQMVMEEGTNRLYFHYFDMEFGDPAYDYGRASTIGINSGSPTGIIRHLYSRNEASLRDRHAIRFTPQPVPAFDATAQIQLKVGRPVASVAPGSLDASVAAGADGTSLLVIDNAGTRALNWHLSATVDAEPPPSNAQIPGFAWMDTTFESLVTFDVAAPEGSLVEINEGVSRILHGGDFVGNDFSGLYSFDWNGTQLVIVDTDCANCGLQVVGNAMCPNPSAPSGFSSCPGEWEAASYDPTSGWLYVLGDANGGRSTLYRVNPHDTGDLESVGVIRGVETTATGYTAVHTIAISPEGRMYGIEARSNKLVAIDKVSGKATVIGDLGIEISDGWRPPLAMDFDDATGALYLAANLRLYRVSLETGRAVDLGEVSPHPLDSFAVATATPCTHPDDVPWLSLDQAAGSVAPGGAVEVGVDFHAGDLAPGPYSTTLCLDSNDPLRGRAIVPVILQIEG